MRKKGDEEKALGGRELALLEEENVDWERVWNRRVAGDELPASLGELRYVSTVVLPLVGRSENSAQTGGRAYDRHSHGQRPPRPQSGVVVVFCPCDPGWYPSSVQLYKLSLKYRS